MFEENWFISQICLKFSLFQLKKTNQRDGNIHTWYPNIYNESSYQISNDIELFV